LLSKFTYRYVVLT